MARNSADHARRLSPQLGERMQRMVSVVLFGHVLDKESNMTRGVGGHSPANITHHLKGVDFPASKQDLEKRAKDNGADKEVLETIRGMPDDRFESMADVMKAYGKEH